MEILQKYKGETWDWDSKNKVMNFTNREQGQLDVYMKWINGWILESILLYLDFRCLEKEADKNIIKYITNEVKNYIELLENVGFYPKEEMHKECIEAKEIFERELTCYEIYKVAYNLNELEKRYQLLIFEREIIPAFEKWRKKAKEKEEYMKKLYNTPTMFKYH